MKFLGDIHGNFHGLRKICEKHPKIVQVGDFGIMNKSPNINDLYENGLRFIRGNHDNPFLVSQEKGWIADGTMVDEVFYVGGAYSIDHKYRTLGYDWWPEEELSSKDFELILTIYEKLKPDIVCTHDGTETSIRLMMADRYRPEANHTRTYLDLMLQIHRPKIWLHGHWHLDRRMNIDGTEFISIGIESIVEI